MTPTAGQFYGSQIPSMGMNITNIANHMQKPTMTNVSLKKTDFYQFIVLFLSNPILFIENHKNKPLDLLSAK